LETHASPLEDLVASLSIMTTSKRNSAKDFARDLDRPRQDCIITCERQDSLPQGARFSRNDLATIRDIDGQDVDPMQMREKIRGFPVNDLKQDIVFFSRLFTCPFVPFTTTFLELCMEVGHHWQKGERVLCDIKGDIIMNFNLDAIKTTFQWTSKGNFEYNEAESLACYQDTHRVAIAIRSWMLDEHHGLKGNALINAPHSNFYPSVELMILMLSRILGKEDASKFRKEFFGFIMEIARGKRIKWSKVLSDTIAEQLSSMGTKCKFYLNSYLVYMLLHGKYRTTTKGEVAWIEKGTYAIWKCYPKWKVERRWDSFFTRNDG